MSRMKTHNGSDTWCAVVAIVLFLLTLVSTKGVAIIDDPEDIRDMDWREIDELFKMGTIDEGIPEGYGYGIAVVQRGGAIIQAGTDVMWHGKRFQIVSGDNCPGHDCGAKGAIFNYLGAGPVKWQEMPGICYIGHFRNVKPQLKTLELDDKLSVIVDYLNGGGDEIRLVNSEKRLYLGRGADWTREAEIFAYFVLQFSDTPKRIELSWIAPEHHEARAGMYRAAGAPGEPNTDFVQARPQRLRERLAPGV